VFTAGLQEDPSATSLRAKLIECLIVVRNWDIAAKTASDGVALGQEEFQAELARVRRIRATDSTNQARRPTR
jgi:thiamine monophosphate synthase